MIELAQQRGTAVGHPLDQRHLPQRARAVEIGHHRHLGQVDQHRESARLRGGHTVKVPVEIELGVLLPTRG